jgi:hypothetical protein
MKHTHTDSDYYDYYHTKLYSTNKQQQPKPISERRSDESENLTGSPQKKKKKKNIQMVFGPKTKIGRGCEKISSQELVISLFVFCFVSHTNKTIRQVIGIATLDEVTTSFGGNLFSRLIQEEEESEGLGDLYQQQQQLDASDLLMLYLDLLFSPSVVYNHFFSSSSSSVVALPLLIRLIITIGNSKTFRSTGVID